jgi:hypothetical protein
MRAVQQDGAPMQPSQKPLVILGTGYTGRFIYAHAAKQGMHVLASSRSPHTRLTAMPTGKRITFDLESQETWQNIPRGSHLIWCFPAVPQEAVERFAEKVLTQVGRVVVLGSTSAYDVGDMAGTAPPSVILESSPIDLARPRVRCEEYLRIHHQAIILRVAGIYGPGRNVLDWIRHGKVGALARYVNLIHVEDLAAICVLALERGRPGETYNVSDGQPRLWSDICQEASQRWRLGSLEISKDHRPGKRISNKKLLTELEYTFRYPDLFAALDLIESTKSKS